MSEPLPNHISRIDQVVETINAILRALRTFRVSFGEGIRYESNENGTLAWVERQDVTAGFFAVQVEKDGGTDGDATTKATYTYTVRSLSGVTLGTLVPQTRPRPYGEMTFQTGDEGYGIAFYAADGSLKLFDAGEVQTTYSCPDPT